MTLTAGGTTLSVRTIDTAGNITAGTGHSYTLETAGPTAVATVTALSSDSGAAGDFITNVASQTVSGTFTGTLGVGEKIQVSVDGSTWIDATAGAGTFSAAGVTLRQAARRSRCARSTRRATYGRHGPQLHAGDGGADCGCDGDGAQFGQRHGR